MSLAARRLDEAHLDRERVKVGGLHAFMALAWSHVGGAGAFRDNWHLHEIAHHLEAQSSYELNELVINIPPGTGKSMTVNILWPAWDWITYGGSSKWIYGSYDPSLVGARDGGRLLALLQNDWFVERWGNLLAKSVSSASSFQTAGGGFRFATSPGGRGLGRHADHVVADDPVKPADTMGRPATTQGRLREVSLWWSGTMSLRQSDPTRHTRTIVQQRLHKSDLAGEMAERGYVVLSLPMRAEARPCRTAWGGDQRTAEGELLFPERFPEITVSANEKTLGPLGTAAQYQQRPYVEGGTVFRRDWWRFWGKGRELCLCDECVREGVSSHDPGRDCVPLPERGWDFQSWDLTFKGTVDSDFVAGQRWRAYGGNFYLLAMLNERMGFTETLDRMRSFGPAGEPRLVEDQANGPAVAESLAGKMEIELVKPEGGKEARANAVTPLFSEGLVYLPAVSESYTLIAQAEAFPFDVHDDQVDAMTQALVHAQSSSGMKLTRDMAAFRKAKR